MNGSYDDMLYLPHPVSKRHPQMSRPERAAQFSPFAALTGYEEAVRESARKTVRRVEVGEDERAELDERFRILAEAADSAPEVQLCVFVRDDEKPGGAYEWRSGRLRRLSSYDQTLTLTDGSTIRLEDIYSVDSPCLNCLDDFT